MGFIKDQKQLSLAKDAQRAIDEGHRVFVAKLNLPGTHHGMSGTITDWAVMIEGVEELGWKLAEWSVTSDNKGRPEAYPLFRR